MKNSPLLLLLLSIFTCSTLSALNFSDSSTYFFTKGVEEKAAKRFLTASVFFDKAIALNKSYTEAYIENAYSHKEMRNTDKAKAHFTKANELQPANMDVVKELTNIYYDYRQWDKALEFAQKCVSCDNAERIIGLCHYEKENYVAAEKSLLKSLAKNAEDAQVNYTLARAYMDMEQYRKSVPYYEKAAALNPQKNVWAYELGLLYYNNNNYRSAVTAFETAAKNGYPVSNDYNENYGYSLLYSGQYAKGEERLMSIYAKKGNKEMLRDLAQILYEQKQFNRSLDFCQKLLEIDAKDSKALYQAGLTFQKMGQKDKGQGMCDKAIEMDPSLASKRTKSMDLGAGAL